MENVTLDDIRKKIFYQFQNKPITISTNGIGVSIQIPKSEIESYVNLSSNRFARQTQLQEFGTILFPNLPRRHINFIGSKNDVTYSVKLRHLFNELVAI